jgi:hypothetical protein
MQSQKKMNFSMPLHRKHCKEGATVVTQFWIHQDFLECYFISIIIYKNPKKLRKSLKFKKIFFSSQLSFSIKTDSTGSIRVKPCQPG